MNTARVIANMEAFVAVLDKAPDVTGMDFAAEHGWIEYSEYEAARAELAKAEATAAKYLDAIRQVQVENPAEFREWMLESSKQLSLPDRKAQAKLEDDTRRFVEQTPSPTHLKTTFSLLIGALTGPPASK